MRVYQYARSQSLIEDSFDQQLRQTSLFAARSNLPTPSPYFDTGEARNGLDRMLAAASKGDVILVTDLSRLGRDILQSLVLMRELRNRGVRVVLTGDPLCRGSEDVFGLAALEAVADRGGFETTWRS